MPFSLSLVPAAIALFAAIVQYRIANASLDWPAPRRTRWNRMLLVAIAAGILTTGYANHREAVQAEHHRIATAEATQAREEAARQERAELSAAIHDVAGLLGDLEPGSTDQEALREIGNEIRRLRDRASELEDDLEGLRRYREVAALNLFGLTGKYGAGLKESTALSRALEGVFEAKGDGPRKTYTPVCGAEGLDRLERVVSQFPHFPFSRWAIAVCLRAAGDPRWRGHAQRAMEILGHTVQIEGHHSDHDALREQVKRFLGRE